MRETSYTIIDGRKEDNANNIAEVEGWLMPSSTARTLANTPSFDKGTPLAQIVSYMKTLKTPASVRNITEHMMRKRNYSSYSSAVRSTSKYVLNLANWNVLKVEGTKKERLTKREATTFSLNKALKRSR